MTEIARLRSSSRSAPATRSSRWSHCQTHSPAAVARVARVRAEDTTRWWRPLNTAPISTTQMPTVSAMIGDTPA